MLGDFPPLPNDLLKAPPINSVREQENTSTVVSLSSIYYLENPYLEPEPCGFILIHTFKLSQIFRKYIQYSLVRNFIL